MQTDQARRRTPPERPPTPGDRRAGPRSPDASRRAPAGLLAHLTDWLTDPRGALRDAVGPEGRLRVRLYRHYRDPRILVRPQVDVERSHLERLFQEHHGRPLDLDRPASFSEKVQWRKLYDRRPLFERIVDKIAVRDLVADRVGEAYLVPLLAVGDTVADLAPQRIPAPFIVKPSHASGVAVQVRNRRELDPDALARRLGPVLEETYGLWGVEWGYWHVPHRLMAERLLLRPDGRVPFDHKIHVFGGRARFVEVHADRFDDHRYAVYDRDWRKTGIRYRGRSRTDVRRPDRLEEMLEVAEALAAGLGYLRVDLYAVEGRVYVGELTLYPTSGFFPIDPVDWDRRWGEMWDLPEPRCGT